MYRRRRNDSTDPSRAEVAIPLGCEWAHPDMSNSRGKERRRRSDMPGSQAARVVFRSRPWSGTARAATPTCLIRQSRWSGAGPRRGLCVARRDLPPTGTSRGSTPPSEGPCEGGTPTPDRTQLSTPGLPNPRLAHGPVRCLCVSAQRPRGPVTNCLALPPRATGKRFGSAHYAASAHQHARARSALRNACARAYTRARTRAHRRPTANDTTCGPPAWLPGRLHEEGTRGAYAHRLDGPLSSRPLSPRPCKTAAPKGPASCFLNDYPSGCPVAQFAQT